jgi:uncharacterized RDD family membrane protein YckC
MFVAHATIARTGWLYRPKVARRWTGGCGYGAALSRGESLRQDREHMRRALADWARAHVRHEVAEGTAVLATETHRAAQAVLPERLRALAGPEYSTFRRRVVAYLADGLLVVPLGVASWVVAHTGPGPAAGALTALLQVAPAAYLLLLHRFGGQTLGKRLTGVVVIDEATGGRLSWRQAAIRCAIQLAAAELALAGALVEGHGPGSETFEALTVAALAVAGNAWAAVDCGAAAFDPRRRAWHDRVAGTVVVQVGGRPQPAKAPV